MDSLF